MQDAWHSGLADVEETRSLWSPASRRSRSSSGGGCAGQAGAKRVLGHWNTWRRSSIGKADPRSATLAHRRSATVPRCSSSSPRRGASALPGVVESSGAVAFGRRAAGAGWSTPICWRRRYGLVGTSRRLRHRARYHIVTDDGQVSFPFDIGIDLSMGRSGRWQRAFLLPAGLHRHCRTLSQGPWVHASGRRQGPARREMLLHDAGDYPSTAPRSATALFWLLRRIATSPRPPTIPTSPSRATECRSPRRGSMGTGVAESVREPSGGFRTRPARNITAYGTNARRTCRPTRTEKSVRVATAGRSRTWRTRGALPGS